MRSLVAICLLVFSVPLAAQESDFELKERYRERVRALDEQITNATTTRELDSLRNEINSLQSEYVGRKEFLDQALYPESYASTLEQLRLHIDEAYQNKFIIQTQGSRIVELEARINEMITEIDSLSVQRDKYFDDLKTAQQSNRKLREAINQLGETIRRKDELIFALVDSIFLQYQGLNEASEVQMDELNRRLRETDALDRVYEIATDNLHFVEALKLQPRDYAALIEQLEVFEARWKVLREKVIAASAPARSQGGKTPSTTGKTSPTPAEELAIQQANVDSVVREWNQRLLSQLWTGIANEFLAKGITVQPFIDGKSFGESIRVYVQTAKFKKSDETVFVEDVWKDRIDSEWRASLVKSNVLGQAAYAELDGVVSELAQKTLDWKVVGAIAIVFLIVITFVWRRARNAQLMKTGA